MADSLDLLTVAEGIETTAQLRELRKFGCDLGQGYLLSQPLEAERPDVALRAAGRRRRLSSGRGRSTGACAISTLHVHEITPVPHGAGDRVMRIGMVCPYSLSIPGGVQAQVLGLARELRRQGHEVRVLGPCDGPPPESFVTPLGDSLPTCGQRLGRAARTRSVGDAAHDAGAARRAVRRDPRPRTARARAPDHDGHPAHGADRRHVPRRRAVVGLPHARRHAAAAARPHRRKVVVSKDALELRRSRISATRDVHGALQRGRDDRDPRPSRRSDATARRSSSSAGTRSARASACCCGR